MPDEALNGYLKDAEPTLSERDRNPGRGRNPGPGYPTRTIVWWVVLAGAGLIALALVLPALSAECAIKGKVSRSGAKIYHMPGSPAHAATLIDERRGERLFCSEDEARAAGWRPAKGRAGREGPECSKGVENPFRLAE